MKRYLQRYRMTDGMSLISLMIGCAIGIIILSIAANLVTSMDRSVKSLLHSLEIHRSVVLIVKGSLEWSQAGNRQNCENLNIMDIPVDPSVVATDFPKVIRNLSHVTNRGKKIISIGNKVGDAGRIELLQMAPLLSRKPSFVYVTLRITSAKIPNLTTAIRDFDIPMMLNVTSGKTSGCYHMDTQIPENLLCEGFNKSWNSDDPDGNEVFCE